AARRRAQITAADLQGLFVDTTVRSIIGRPLRLWVWAWRARRESQGVRGRYAALVGYGDALRILRICAVGSRQQTLARPPASGRRDCDSLAIAHGNSCRGEDEGDP